jgi:hypothetical protein
VAHLPFGVWVVLVAIWIIHRLHVVSLLAHWTGGPAGGGTVSTHQVGTGGHQGQGGGLSTHLQPAHHPTAHHPTAPPSKAGRQEETTAGMGSRSWQGGGGREGDSHGSATQQQRVTSSALQVCSYNAVQVMAGRACGGNPGATQSPVQRRN